MSGSASWKSGIVAFGSTALGPESQRFSHRPPVFSDTVESGGASERNPSWPRTAWQA